MMASVTPAAAISLVLVTGETFAGEEVEGGFDELKAAVAGAKAWGGGGEGGFVWDGASGFILFGVEGKMASFGKSFTGIPGWAPVAMAGSSTKLPRTGSASIDTPL